MICALCLGILLLGIMIVEKIGMVDALNIEVKELMNSYQQMLENMSKEELIAEIGRLLVDKGLLLSSMDGYINELKEDNSRLNELLAGGTEVMDYWQDKYLEEKSKNDELQKQINECNRDCEEYAIENGELLQQVNWLKEDMHTIVSAENETYMIGFEDGEKKGVKDTTKKILLEMLARAKRLKEQFDSTTYGTNREHLISTIEIEIEGIKNLAKRYEVEVE